LSQQLIDTEPKLAQLIRQGDPQAFRRLFEDLVRPLVYFGIRLTGNESESEDAASEAFHQLWLKRQDMGTYPEIRSYLYTIVHNRCMNFLKRQKLIESTHKKLEIETGPVSNKDFDARIVQAETMVAIYRAIEYLPLHQQELIYKSYIEERSTNDIATEQGRTEGYIRTTRARALAALRKVLKEQNLIQYIIFLFSFWQAK
jgi:RNA polymerase sigma factor (sigma-70 family)